MHARGTPGMRHASESAQSNVQPEHGSLGVAAANAVRRAGCQCPCMHEQEKAGVRGGACATTRERELGSTGSPPVVFAVLACVNRHLHGARLHVENEDRLGCGRYQQLNRIEVGVGRAISENLHLHGRMRVCARPIGRG